MKKLALLKEIEQQLIRIAVITTPTYLDGKVEKTTAKRLAKEIVLDILDGERIVAWADGVGKETWDAMTDEEQREVGQYHEQYIQRLKKIVKGIRSAVITTPTYWRGKVEKTTAKRLAKEIIIFILKGEGIVSWSEYLGRDTWNAMTGEERLEVHRYYNQYIERLLRIVG